MECRQVVRGKQSLRKDKRGRALPVRYLQLGDSEKKALGGSNDERLYSIPLGLLPNEK